jgi:hypothetical protein
MGFTGVDVIVHQARHEWPRLVHDDIDTWDSARFFTRL